MTASAFVKLHCDWPGCYGRIQTHKLKVTEARKHAAAFGWKHISGIDLCGSRDQAAEYSAELDRHSLRGHAAREDHVPVLRPSRKGYVWLSCLCKWENPAQYSWERAGECPRGSVQYRWSEHVKESLAANTSTVQDTP